MNVRISLWYLFGVILLLIDLSVNWWYEILKSPRVIYDLSFSVGVNPEWMFFQLIMTLLLSSIGFLLIFDDYLKGKGN